MESGKVKGNLGGMVYDLLTYPDAGALVGAVAARWLADLARPRRLPLPYSVALSGGRIARPLYEAVVTESAGRRSLWAEVEFFFADERQVPLDHPESNYRLARESLFEPLGIPARRVHAFQTGAVPEFAAAQAQAELLHRAPQTRDGQPSLDLVLLGMGEDGHVASLFPGAPPEVVESRAVFLPVTGPKPPPQRITISYAVLAAARQVWVLISGAGKEEALARSLDPAGQTPLAHVLRGREATVLFADRPRA